MSDEPVYTQISDKYGYVSGKNGYENKNANKSEESFGALKLQVAYLDEAVYDLSLKLKPFMTPEVNTSPAPSSSAPENCSPYYAELHTLADKIERIRIAIITLNERIELP
ncbi:MAG: hypothetical protein IPI51_06895 [Betaproteobacteria bacterium]|nr:hypothetical protein [Betaproteobacteria bacterium]